MVIVPELILEQVINGLLVGSFYIALSLGLSLIFGLGGVVNLAHGAFYAVGAYLAFEVEKRLGFFGAMALSPVGVALLGILIERLFLSRLAGHRREPRRRLRSRRVQTCAERRCRPRCR